MRLPGATHSESFARTDTGTLFGQTMGLVAITSGLFALGAYLGRNTTYHLGWVWFIAAFACLFGINIAVRRSEALSIGMLFAFGVLMGLATAPTIAYYATTNPQVVWQSGGATALFIAGFGAAGYATRRDLSALARVCFWALVGLIVFGLVIFAGFTMFDFQRLRSGADIRTAPVLAASIFLDILNVFMLMLSLFGGRRN